MAPSKQEPLFVLSEFRLAGWKSFRQASLPLRPLTLLIGANASGKSNLLEGIRFLSLLAKKGRNLDEVWRETHDGQIAIRGERPEALFFRDLGELELGCECAGLPDLREIIALQMKLRLQEQAEERLFVSAEELFNGSGQLYKLTTDASTDSTLLPSKLVEKNGNGFLDQPYPRVLYPLFARQQDPVESSDGSREWRNQAPRLSEALKRVQFLDLSPSVMRGASFPADDRLREDGRNVSAVLFNLCKRPENKADVLAFIRSLPEQRITDISFPLGARRDVVLALTESFGGTARTYDATQLSDGTLRALAIVAALLSVKPGTLLVIEEIDNGLHPSRAKHLMSEIDRLARKRSLRVLSTTHNPALVDALPLSAVPDIVLCYRDPKDGDSRLVALEQLPDYPALVGHQSVGQLMTSGKLEKAIHAIGEPEETRRVQASHSVSRFLAELEGGTSVAPKRPKSRRATDKASS